MTKQHILDEIRRTSRANGGAALGSQRFARETGIKKSDWYGKYWTHWGAALQEAGLSPNELSRAYETAHLIEALIELMRELQPPRFPVEADIRMKARATPGFPSFSAFTRLGGKSQRAVKVTDYCIAKGGLEDVLSLCRVVPVTTEQFAPATGTGPHGYVYLFQHGNRHEYKIGKTFNPLRREGEIAIQLPERLKPVHYIKTDDPSGVESYWHRRFADKRKEGEWFTLTSEDVRAFKRWKHIY